MYWQEKTQTPNQSLDDQIVDYCFNVTCKTLPIDHAWALSQALKAKAPWLISAKKAAMHVIHVAESSNGWQRPNDQQNAVLHLSQRTRLRLRLHRDDLQKAQSLTNETLDIQGHSLTLNTPKIIQLVPQTTIFARYVLTQKNTSEDDFLNSVAPQIQALGVHINKMMGGKKHTFYTPSKQIFTRSLMISELQPDESITLQQNGIGDFPLLGMGIFLPHKGIAAVNIEQEQVFNNR